MLLDLQATRKHATSWSVIVYMVACAEDLPEWWRDASRRCPDPAPLDVPGAFERLMRDHEDDEESYDDDE
jgi:hypothetical protein